MTHHLHDRRVRAARARFEAQEVREIEMEARDMKIGTTVLVTCSVCRAVNEVPANGVPKIECTGCGRILVVPAARRPGRLETRYG